jgi:transglutaminase-like putative cysteine protease
MTTGDAAHLGTPAPFAGLRAKLRRRRPRPQPAPLAFAREKRLLLGAIALLVAVPFPLNEPRPDGVVSWPVLILYLGAIGVFLARSWEGAELGLPPWTMNVAGLVYLPLFLLRLRAIGPTHIARPMVELLMFGLVMRLFGMRREREKWQVAVLLFFLFVAAMATSLHPLILLYLLVGFVLWLVLLVRFLQLHLEATYPLEVPDSKLHPRSLLAAFTVLTLVTAVPFFTLLPRLRTPYIMGEGGGSRQTGYSTGFRDEVNLDVVGTIRQSPVVALRIKPEDSTVRPPTLLRGTTYDLFQENSWLRSRSQQELLDKTTSNLYRLAPGAIDAKLRIFLEPLDSRSLILPLEAVTVELSQLLYQDVAGGILMLQPRSSLLEYRVGIASRPVYRADAPLLDDPAEPTLDRGGITPRIEDLATRLGSGLPAEDAARHIQRYLGDNMAYSLDFVGRDADNPIEDFLFRYKSGHCEYFATAMILMLRSVGIPARLATGFLGAEFNPLEDYYIVRQSNAHAWVEAYFPETGWTTLDPTPPSGRPAVETRPTMTLMLRQAWDYLEFRWDRYVMSYGFFDQVGYLLKFRDFMRRLARSGERPVPSLDRGHDQRQVPGLQGAGDFDAAPVVLALVALLAGLVLVLVWRARSSLPVATRAFRAMRTAAARRDPSIGATTGPIALARWLERNAPAALTAGGGGVIDLYLLESWSGERLSRRQASAVRRDLRQARRMLRRRRGESGPRADP